LAQVMTTREATDLLRPAIQKQGGTWADWGAGSGTFTKALVTLLGPEARVIAVDRDAAALRRLGKAMPQVTVVHADFTEPLPLSDTSPLDGMLLANALHFVEDQPAVLSRLSQRLRVGGRVVLIEYDGRGPNRWVPYPVPAARWPELAHASGLDSPVVRTRRPSAYGGDLYVATADRE